MGRISIAAFRPKPGREADLLAVMRDRLPLLRRLGMATDRADVTMRARDGTIVQVSEWASDDAIDRAHRTPEVLALWKRFSECCDYVRLGSLKEAAEDFATFDAIN